MAIRCWNVSELTQYLRQMFEVDYRLQDLEVEAEVSNWRAPGSGHAYFTLKDSNAQLRCVMWRSDVITQTVLPRDGDRVIARGHLGVYETGGQYQLYCRSLRPAGAGDLTARFEELKARLAAEGLFDPARKRPLPLRPGVIGVVTSPDAAALQDVLTVLRRRNPLARVILSPTTVQGDQAPAQIVAALELLNALPDIDLILLVRGGGSLEDLWCFNDERVAYAVATSRAPVIVGVGHEIDFTLADFVADVRAATPSAAAELASPVTVEDRRMAVAVLREALSDAGQYALDRQRRQVERAALSLRHLAPRARLDAARQRIDGLVGQAVQAVHNNLGLRRARLSGLSGALAAMSPRGTLARGYAIVRAANDGRALRQAAEAPPGTPLRIDLYEGYLQAIVESSQ